MFYFASVISPNATHSEMTQPCTYQTTRCSITCVFNNETKTFVFEIVERPDGTPHIIGGGLEFASRCTINITRVDNDGGCHVSVKKKEDPVSMSLTCA